MAYASTNPCNGQVLQGFGEFDDAAVDALLQAAQTCFSTQWRDTGFPQRRAVLARAAALMRERAPQLAELITLEMGKLIAQSQGEVGFSAAILDYYAEHAESFLAPETLVTPRGRLIDDPRVRGVALTGSEAAGAAVAARAGRNLK